MVVEKSHVEFVKIRFPRPFARISGFVDLGVEFMKCISNKLTDDSHAVGPV